MSNKVLIVDDDSDFVEAISTLLEAKGYAVVSAPEGKTGFSQAKQQLPGLIILDVMMATKSEGFDVAKQLKNDPATKEIPVVLITGIKRDMNLPFGFEPDEDWLPVKAVLEKPVKPDLLLKTVEEYINK
ncbi:MAG: response regulator [Candidatus Omnitrophica bacterium]|nr:response regulator [Candidatus Omnitrophota bacterium]